MCPVALEMNVIYKKKINVKSLRKMFLCTPRVSTPDWFIGFLSYCQKIKKMEDKYHIKT